MLMLRLRQQRAIGSMRGVLVAAVLLAMLSLCLARVVDAATASSSSLGPPWEKGVLTAVDEVGQEEAAVEGRGITAVVHERVAMEVSINDYPDSRANSRHNPSHP